MMPRGRAEDLNRTERRTYSMKTILKNLAKHFALYGQRATENLGL